MNSLAQKCTLALSGIALATLSLTPAHADISGGYKGAPTQPTLGSFAPPQPLPMDIWTVANARVGVYQDINEIRLAHGLAPVTYSSTLSWTSNNCLGEIMQSPYQADRACYNFGQPMIQGYEDAAQSVVRSATTDEVVNKLMATASGRAKILNPNFTHVGVSMGYVGSGQFRYAVTFADYPVTVQLPAGDSKLPATSFEDLAG